LNWDYKMGSKGEQYGSGVSIHDLVSVCLLYCLQWPKTVPRQIIPIAPFEILADDRYRQHCSECYTHPDINAPIFNLGFLALLTGVTCFGFVHRGLSK
jgi:hypothetical protein